MQLRQDFLAISQAGLRAAGAGPLLAAALSQSDLGNSRGRQGAGGMVHIVAAGKAAASMASAAVEHFGSRVRAGLAVSPVAAMLPASIESLAGGHPAPTADSARAGQRALDIAGSVEEDETLVILLSGGASALLAVPAAGLTLEDKRAVTDRLLQAGADITALNTVRKHVSAIKGGRLAARCRGRVAAFAISDVVGDDPSVIASGPTVADPTTFGDALQVLSRFGGLALYPSPVVNVLQRGAAGEIEETLKPGDPRLSRSSFRIVGDQRDAARGAYEEARRRGYGVLTIDEPIVGEARAAGRRHLDRVARPAASIDRPFCALSTGETTVTVTGSGRGGRNQEFVLGAVAALADEQREEWTMFRTSPFVLASLGTDGIDGPTDAAGALADSATLERARAAGLPPPHAFLDDNNAYAFFDAIGDLIHTGPTDTNVGDLQIVLVS